jgi:hypothetical protein
MHLPGRFLHRDLILWSVGAGEPPLNRDSSEAEKRREESRAKQTRRCAGRVMVCPAPFYKQARAFHVPQSPDLVIAGDFDNDGHRDVMAETVGSGAAYFFLETGGFCAPQKIKLARP